MGLKEDINNAVSEAFDTDLADAAKTFLHRSIESSYDPSTGVARVILESQSRGVFDAFTKAELADETILPTDVALTVLQSEMENIPKVDDEIIRNDTGVNYKVIGFSKDPADVTYVIQLRTSANG